MKKYILISLMMVFTTVMTIADAKDKKEDTGTAAISFAEETYDFGTIAEKGGSVSHEFEFVNTGNGKLVIYEATAQCGCTRPEFSKKPFAPGAKGKVKVTYNPKGRPGAFTKIVTVRCNGKPSKVRLKISGTVTPGK